MPTATGTLMVKDRSHLEHAAFFEHHTCLTREQQEQTADFYMFQKEELPYWEAFQSLALSGKAGSLFLWDSRTAHQNVLPKLSEAWRQVCYVCFQPRWVDLLSLCCVVAAVLSHLLARCWEHQQVTLSSAS